MFRARVIFVFFLLTLLSSPLFSQSPSGTTEKISIPAASLAGNLLGDPTVQPAIVYLPNGYRDQPQRHYPVLYLLHGFSLHPILNDWCEVITDSMNSYLATHPDRAFIVVIPNGANKIHGSYYLNSPVTGNWETYITKDVVTYIDSHYRTIPNRASRAIAGHSMGGFAALRFVALYPEIFSSAYAISPCCLDFQADMTAENPAWKSVLAMKSLVDIQSAADRNEFWPVALAAFALAASPNPSLALKADLPYRLGDGQLAPDPATIARWRAVMPVNFVRLHAQALTESSGIAIDYGYQDEFAHIPLTARLFADQLQSLHIPISLEAYNGNHNDGVPPRIESRVIPFVADHLAFK